MILNFYLTSLFFILLSLGIAVVKQTRETIIRSLTLLLLLHIICLVLWQGTVAFTIFIAVILALSLYELSKSYQVNYLLLALVSLLLFILGFYSNGQLIELAAFWLIVISSITFNSSRSTIRSPSFLFSFSSCFLILGSIFLIKLMETNGEAVIVILLLLQFNDAFGYLFGKKFGKTHLFPTISPGKTLEGYLWGGVGITIGIVLLHTYIPILSTQGLLKDIVLFTSILTLGNLGDLMISSLKRKLEIKDFSKILPGHGGILDRFDNIFFIAPIFYVLLKHHLIL